MAQPVTQQDTQPPAETLAACPHCGASSIRLTSIRDGYEAGCRCGASVSAYNPDSRRKAIAAWNRRAGGDAGAAEDERLTPENALAFAEQEIRHWPEGSQGQTAAIRARNLMRNLVRALALPAPVVEGWQEIKTANRDSMTEIDMWCASAEADGEGWNLRGILMIGTPDWIKREDGSDYFPHENGGFLTHWRPVPAPPVAARAALSEGRSHG